MESKQSALRCTETNSAQGIGQRRQRENRHPRAKGDVSVELPCESMRTPALRRGWIRHLASGQGAHRCGGGRQEAGGGLFEAAGQGEAMPKEREADMRVVEGGGRV